MANSNLIFEGLGEDTTLSTNLKCCFMESIEVAFYGVLGFSKVSIRTISNFNISNDVEWNYCS